MERKKQSGRFDPSTIVNDYELITRRMRWLAIFTIFICFPFEAPRTFLVYGLTAMAFLYNISRYMPFFMRSKPYASPLSMLLVDTTFILVLIGMIGSFNTPFSVFLVFPIISAAYRYRLQGTLIVVGGQLLIISTVLTHHWFRPLVVGNVQSGLATAALMVGLGIFVERLTRMEHAEKDKLSNLSHEIEAERKHLMTLVNSLTDAIFVVSGSGKVIDCNAAAETISNTTGNLKNTYFKDIIDLHPRVNFDSKPVDLLSTKEPQRRRDLSIKDENGAVTDLDVSVQPVVLEGSNTTDFIIVCKDITKERTIEEERTEFISVASHELRTPITIMEAALSAALLSKDKLDEQTLLVLQEAHRHCLYLSNIVKDLSLMAHASNDNLPIELTNIDSGTLLRQMIHDFEGQAKQKNLKIEVRIAEGTPTVLSTENHIREIMQNYITNALKYSNEGTIVVGAKPSKRGGVVLSVKDTGIGISPADQKHLFTKFFRSEDYRTRQTGGTGLGLYLCRELAQRLSGKVWCESKLNEGSTFYLEVPPVSYLKRDQGEVVKAEVANLVEGI